MDILLNILITVISSVLAYYISYLLLKRKSKAFEIDYVNAQSSLQKSDYESAIKDFEEVISSVQKNNPIYISTLVGLYDSYKGINDYNKAKEYLEMALYLSKKSKHGTYIKQLSKLKDNL